MTLVTCRRRNCLGTLDAKPDDPALPDHIELLECNGCGEVYERDGETGELEVDG